MDTEKRLAKRVAFLRKSIYISCGNINEAMNTLSCGSLYEAIRGFFFHCLGKFMRRVYYCVFRNKLMHNFFLKNVILSGSGLKRF